MLKENLINRSLAYEVLKKYCRFAYQIFYNNISIEGKENIPQEGPVIFAPNHQNALMDALAVVLFANRQPVFMAKADIFKNNLSKKILHFLKIIPVYRMRDGKENLIHNDESFDIALQCLMNNNSFGIMPEGTDIDKQRLRPLKKGVSKIALRAQELVGNQAGVKIVPVGIHYNNYQKFRSNICISFGKPIEVKDYMVLYQENQLTAIANLRDALTRDLKKLMINIDNDQYYQLIYDIKEITASDIQSDLELPSDSKGRFISEKIITEQLLRFFAENSKIADSFKPWVDEYLNTMKRLKLKNSVFQNHFPGKNLVWDIIRYTLALPFVFAGSLFNAIPAVITWFFSSKIKDTQYVSSFKFAIGLIAFTLYYFVFLFMPFPLLFKLIIFISMPILGILAYDYFKGLKIFFSATKFRIHFNRSEPSYSRLQYVRLQIVKKVKDLINSENGELV